MISSASAQRPRPGPVAVFDSGLGSLCAVETIRSHHPDRDILYLADRARFPYGELPVDELRTAVGNGARALEGLGAALVVVASNTPSVQILDDLRATATVPLVGVRPPLRAAVAHRGGIAILGTRSLVTGSGLSEYVEAWTPGDRDRIVGVNAGELVDLVESGRFVRDPEAARRVVDGFAARLLAAVPDLAVGTLSSTHLPWLRPALERAMPHVTWLDPLDHEVLPAVAEHTLPGRGTTTCLVTEGPELTAEQFVAVTERLGVALRPQVARWSGNALEIAEEISSAR